MALLGVVRGGGEPAGLQARPVEGRDRAPPSERPRQLRGDPGRAVTRDRDHGDARLGLLQAAASLELARELARQGGAEGRITFEQHAEPDGVELEQPRVPERPYRRGPRLACQQRELTDRRAGAEHAGHPRAVLRVDDDFQPPETTT